jgi:hypothetical protein
MLRRNDQACNSPDCLITATGLAKSFASCLRTAGSRLASSRANSSRSKGKSEKAAAGLRHGHFRRIHRRKRSNIVGPTLAAILESLNVIDAKRFRCDGIRPEILGLHRDRQLASEAATQSARVIVGGQQPRPIARAQSRCNWYVPTSGNPASCWPRSIRAPTTIPPPAG